MSKKSGKTVESRRPIQEDGVEEGENAGQRFAWLLAPIRDLAQNWTIDIGNVLEEFLSEHGHLPISVDPNDTGAKMNFAEAALLIQGSTSVFSKKVEYLYQLCNQLVKSLSQPTQNQNVDDPARDQNNGGQLETAGDFDDDFLPLDDIPVQNDIDLDDNRNDDGNFVNVAARFRLVRPPMPLSLMPLEEFEKSSLPLISSTGQVLGRRDDFWMNTAKIHPSTGALLLDGGNAALINATRVPGTFATCGQGQLNITLQTPATPDAPPTQFSPNTPRAQHEHAQGPAGHADSTFGGDDDGGYDHSTFDPIVQAAMTVAMPPPLADGNDGIFGTYQTPRPSRKKTQQETMKEIMEDPWRELDWDDDDNYTASSGLHIKPFVKGITHRVPSFPWRSDSQSQEEVAMLEQSLSDFLNDRIRERYGRLPGENWKRPSWPAFDEIFVEERKRKQKAQINRRRAMEAPKVEPPRKRKLRQSQLDREADEREQNISRNLQLIFDNPIEEDDGGAGDIGEADPGDNVDDQACDDGQVDMSDDDDDLDIPGLDHRTRSSYAALTGDHSQLTGQPETYEDLVRSRLEQVVRTIERNMAVSNLTRRVQEWETKMDKALQVDQSRPPFDIRQYSSELLQFFDQSSSSQNQSTSNDTFDFAQLAGTKPQWEVSRYFLAALMQANARNVDLSINGEEGTVESIDTLKLTLISRGNTKK